MSDVSHTSEVIFELVDKAIEDIGLDDVVQVVTNNASNNMGAKKLLLEKIPNIFWTSCATHTINLMLQGIGNMPRFKKVIDQAKAIAIFVYGHTRTLECLRHFTEGREIIRLGVTRKMKGRLDSPLHLTAYLLNPYYSYGNPSIFDDATITEGFINCVETFYHHDEDKQDQTVNTELKKFHNREGPFNKKLTKTCEKFDYNLGRGFLYEDGDDCATVVYRDEEDEEMEGKGIPWSVIGEAVGAEQQLELHRSARVRQLHEGEEFDSEEEEEFDEDEDEFMEPY
ncbi:unnamed protein product [Miscanthus lutarioriparius]|uniref:DUF659 domain-containing protein n=1 Tax=Miscanthus lutarioriparius TaxID=422564 RepID=A0A811QN60_9POAL|nr:unnamed protein product [Miscanthus lutarioriparius]